MDEEIEDLFYKLGAWAWNGYQLGTNHSIAYSVTQSAPPDDKRPTAAEVRHDLMVRMMARRLELFNQLINKGIENHIADKQSQEMLEDEMTSGQFEIIKLYNPARPKQARCVVRHDIERPELECIDRVIAKMNKRFKTTFEVCFMFYPNDTWEDKAKRLNITDRGLLKRRQVMYKKAREALGDLQKFRFCA